MRLVISLCLAYTVFASLEEDQQQWESFKHKYGKLYKNISEENQRFSIFQQNLRKIEDHNRRYDEGNTTYTEGVNQFTDLTEEEFVSLLTTTATPDFEMDDIYEEPVDANPPDTMDWRDKGAVTEVKNQGKCLSCWAFSATGTLEGFYYLKKKKLVSFSEQQLVDCNKDNFGCNRGRVYLALKYIKEHGIMKESRYPYKAAEETCRYVAADVVTKLKKIMRIKKNDENKLKSAVGLLGPISVALDATKLKDYHGGVFNNNDCSQEAVNHGVLAVGYGKDERSGLDYWLVKNSHGKGWGEHGYFRIKRGSNLCGIAKQGMYPLL